MQIAFTDEAIDNALEHLVDELRMRGEIYRESNTYDYFCNLFDNLRENLPRDLYYEGVKPHNIVHRYNDVLSIYIINGKLGIHYSFRTDIDDAIPELKRMNDGNISRKSFTIQDYLSEVEPEVNDFFGTKTESLDTLLYDSMERLNYDMIREFYGDCSFVEKVDTFFTVLGLPKSPTPKKKLPDPVTPRCLAIYKNCRMYNNKGVFSKPEIKFSLPGIISHMAESEFKVERFFKDLMVHEKIHHIQDTLFPETLDYFRKQRDANLTAKLVENYGGIKEMSLENARKVEASSQENAEIINTLQEGHAEFFSNMITGSSFSGADTKSTILWGDVVSDKKAKYKLGSSFIAYLFKEGGMDMVNLAFERIPSRDQLFYPDAYISML